MRSIMTPSFIALLAAVVVPATVLYGGTVDRSYAGGRYALQIDQETRFVQSLEGGVMRGVVVVEQNGDKHLGGVVADPIRAKIGGGDFTQFISASLAGGGGGKAQPVNGAIHQTDYNLKAVASREFTGAVLTEVTLPALDGASKEAAAITIVLQPETVRDAGGKGNVVPDSGAKQQKKWLANAFRVTIPGVDASRVAKVDAISVTRKPAGSAVGEVRDYQKTPPGDWQISNVVLQVAQSHAADFVKWHEDFVVKGNNGPDREKTLTIDMLDPTLQSAVMTVSLSGVGIIAVTPVAAEADSEQIARSRVELYAEKITLSPGGGGTKAPAAAAPTETPAPAESAPAAATPTATEAPAPAQIKRTAPTAAPVESVPTRRVPR